MIIFEHKKELVDFDSTCPGCGTEHDLTGAMCRSHNIDQMTLLQRLRTWMAKPICRGIREWHYHFICSVCGHEWITKPITTVKRKIKKKNTICQSCHGTGFISRHGFTEPCVDCSLGEEHATQLGWGGSHPTDVLPSKTGAIEDSQVRRIIEAKRANRQRDVSGTMDARGNPDGVVEGYKAGGGTTHYPLPTLPQAYPVVPSVPLDSNEVVRK